MKKYFSLYIFILCGLFYATDSDALFYTCDSPGCDNLTIGGNSEYTHLYVNSGGVANNVSFLKNGNGTVNVKGTVNDSVVNGAMLWIYGTANNMEFNSGRIILYTQSEINNLTGKDADGSSYTFSKSANEKDNLIIHKDFAYFLTPEQSVNNIEVLKGGGIQGYGRNQTIANSYIHAGASIAFSSSTTLNNVMFCQSDSNCIILNKAAGIIDGFEILKGMVVYTEDETISGLVINGGNLQLSRDLGDGSATGTILNSGSMHVRTSAYDTTVNGGILYAYDNAVLENTKINDGGQLYFYDNSIIKNAQFVFGKTPSENYTFNKEADQTDGLDIRKRMYYNIYDESFDNVLNGGVIFTYGKVYDTKVNSGGLYITGGGLGDGVTAFGGTVYGYSGSALRNIVMKAGSTLNLYRSENIEDGKPVVSTVELSGDIAIDKDASLIGSYDYSRFFTGGKEANLILVNGVNQKFGNVLHNVEDNKSLTFSDADYKISSDGRDGSTSVSGWETIALRNTDTTDTSLRLASDMSAGEFSVGSGTTLYTEGYNLSGSVTNSGTLDIRSGPGFNDMNVSGDYVSAGGILKIRANPEVNESDKLIIGGDVKGNSKVYVERTTDKDTAGQIYFAEAENDDESTAGGFEIYRVSGSSLVWKTYYDADKKSWYTGKELVTPDPTPDPAPDPDPKPDPNPNPEISLPAKTEVVGEFMAYAGLPRAGLEQSRDLFRNLNSHPHSSSRYGLSSGDYGYSLRGWVNPVYRSISNKEAFAYEADIAGTDLGFEIQDMSDSYGLFFSFRRGNYEYDGKGEKYYSKTKSETDIDSYIGGLYYRHRNERSFLNAMIYGGIQNAELRSDDGVKSETDGKEFGGGIEAGLILRPTAGTRLEPSLSVRYSNVDYDAAADNYGKEVEYGVQSRTELEVGIKVTKEWKLDEGKAEVYAKGAAIQSYHSGDKLQIGDVNNVQTLEDGTLGYGEIGFSAEIGDGWTLSASASHSFGNLYNDTQFNLNVAYSF